MSDTDSKRTVAEVMAERREAREAEEKHRTEAQDRAGKRRSPFGRGTT